MPLNKETKPYQILYSVFLLDSSPYKLKKSIYPIILLIAGCLAIRIYWQELILAFTWVWRRCAVMANDIRNEHGEPISNLDEAVCISHRVNTLAKSVNPIFILPARGK